LSENNEILNSNQSNDLQYRHKQCQAINSSLITCDFKSISDQEPCDIYRSIDSTIVAKTVLTESIAERCKCMYTNADQLQNKLDELRLQLSIVSPDFVFVTEVLPKYNFDNISCSSTLYHIDGYSAFPGTDLGRGVIIYAKTELNVSPNTTLNSFYGDASWIDWISDSKTITLGCIYRSPSNTRNCDEINHLLNMAVGLAENLLITGDFNMKDIDWDTYTTTHGEDHHESLFIECLRDNFLFQHVNQFTRCRNDQSKNILDLILSKDENDIVNLEYLPSLGCSDHVTLLFDFLCDFKIICTGASSYQYRKCDLIRFTEEWETTNWQEYFQHSDANSMWESFVCKFRASVEKFVPKFKPKSGHMKKPLWMTQDSLRFIKGKRHAWNKYMATKRTADFGTYKVVRNAANECVKKSKKNYERTISLKAKSEPKQFWRYVKSKVKSKIGVSNLKRDDGGFVGSDNEKADVLNGFFASVFTKETLHNIPDLPDKTVENNLNDIHVSEVEVLNLLKDIDSSKSMGPDEIHPYLLKSMPDVFVKPLSLIFKKSLSSGEVPKGWKDARISPIFKKGNKTEPCNYRPVSLTSVVCKILEKIVRKHIMYHLSVNNLLSNDQYGFRPHRSCALQLLHVMEDWTKFIEGSESWDSIYLDLAKAFDKVAHRRLIRKVSAYGIKGNVLAWIENFLSQRRQCVSIKGSTSSWISVESGVPQGSVLGPVLFIIYVNDITDSVSCISKIFADDTKLYAPVTDSGRLQEDLDSLSEWAQKWELAFNVDKCKVIHYGNNNPNQQYTMNNKPLQAATEECDLGVLFERDLKFSKHISTKINKANSILALIKRSFEFMDKYLFLKLYTALVRPHVEFANVIWYPYLKKDIISIEKVQKRATKLVPNLRNSSYEERLKELKLPSLAHRRIRGDAIQTFKIVKI
jgi:hypothetical protein